MTVSMGFRTFGFPPACHPGYGASALTPAGLTPAAHISLTWTHNRTRELPLIRLKPWTLKANPLMVLHMAPGVDQALVIQVV